MNPVLFPYRVITGSSYNPKKDVFEYKAFHMTFYAADRMVLMYLITASECPYGKIFSAFDVKIADSGFRGVYAEPSAN